MTVTYTDKSEQVGDDAIALQQAKKQLEEILGKYRGEVNVEWDREVDERGKALYTLRLSAWTFEVSARFTPEELQLSKHMSFLLRGLWGDLLQAKNEQQLEELRRLISAGGLEE